MFYVVHILKKFYYLCTTLVGYILALLWGIKLGKRIFFNGLPIFKRKPNSYVFIGNYCIFNSTENSNLIGINRRSIIATHRKKSQLIIGENCGFSGTVIGAFAKITIGNRVICGGNTLITDSDWHGIKPENRSSKTAKCSPIEIMDNVWLGVNSVVLKGVTIGENSIIAANSVVIKDIPANVVAAGNPCKVIKALKSND
jgi:acetyltransferase-like isoleucine patch superfamily enzyme